MVSLESLWIASYISSFRSFDQRLGGDRFTVISSADNGSG